MFMHSHAVDLTNDRVLMTTLEPTLLISPASKRGRAISMGYGRIFESITDIVARITFGHK